MNCRVLEDRHDKFLKYLGIFSLSLRKKEYIAAVAKVKHILLHNTSRMTEAFSKDQILNTQYSTTVIVEARHKSHPRPFLVSAAMLVLAHRSVLHVRI